MQIKKKIELFHLKQSQIFPFFKFKKSLEPKPEREKVFLRELIMLRCLALTVLTVADRDKRMSVNSGDQINIILIR